MSGANSEANGNVAYVNARLLDPASGLDAMGGLITDGKDIALVQEGLTAKGAPKGAKVVDLKGACLCPGLVDMRVHIAGRSAQNEGTLKSAAWSAAVGGVTTFVLNPTDGLLTDDMSVVEFVARRARKAGLAKVYCYGALTKDLAGENLAELGMLAEAGAVAFTDGDVCVANPELMRQAMNYSVTFDLLVIQHAEEPTLTRNCVMNAGEMSVRLGLRGMPKQAEVIIIERDIRLAEMTGARVHFAHISTKESVDAVRRAKQKGLPVTCDTAAPYFSMNDQAVADYRTFAKLRPPLRSEEDRAAVAEGLSDGTIDAITSDHNPQSEDNKRLPFDQAAFGGVGLETLLPIALELYHKEEMPLLDVLGLLTVKPADVLRLRAGRLSEGWPADFTIFDPGTGWKIIADDLQSKAKNSPFDGRPVQGKVLCTVIDGRTVFEA